MKPLKLVVALLVASGIAGCSAPNPYGYSSGYSSSYSSQAAPTPAATAAPPPSGY